jgi:hypothetical protein
VTWRGSHRRPEPSPYEDTDNDTFININDTNSNDDSYTDDLQVWTVFRTNAADGNYEGASVWVAVIAPSTNPFYPEGYAPLDARAYDYTPSVALYVFNSTRAADGGTPVRNPYGPSPDVYKSIVDLKTPEGYDVYYNATEDSNAGAVYIRVNGAQWERFTKSSDEPGDYSTNVRFDPSFLKNHQETYDGRVAVDMDPDFDGVTTPAENLCGLNPNNNDTDGDGILDGVEFHACQDFNGDGHPDANDTDSDGDGIADNLEDTNLNGRLDAGETDRLGTDTDGDGLADGSEDANHNGIWDVSGGVHNETSPVDRDSDDDGIPDKAENDGTGCYVGESIGACNAAAGAARKTSTTSPDTDGDGIWDGAEIGLTTPGFGRSRLSSAGTRIHRRRPTRWLSTRVGNASWFGLPPLWRDRPALPRHAVLLREPGCHLPNQSL